MAERGAAGREVNETVNEGEQFPVKFGRIGFLAISVSTGNGDNTAIKRSKYKK